jgi:hypothetical protein
MKKRTLFIFVARMAPVAILLLTTRPAQADIVSLTPSAAVVTEGDTFDLDLTAVGIGLGAYDLTISYDPLLVAVDEALVTFDTHLGGPLNSLTFTSAGLDTLELGEVSFLTDPADLAALQPGTGYALAHISVRALQAGIASFYFLATPYTVTSDYAGVDVAGVVFQGTSVEIDSPMDIPSVPEPLSGILLLTIVGWLLLAKWRRCSASKTKPASR